MYTKYSLHERAVKLLDSISLNNDITLPDFLVGYPMGYSISSNSYQIGLCLIPRVKPTQFQCRNYDSRTKFSLFAQVPISSNDFEKWTGVIGDEVTSDDNNRLFIYGPCSHHACLAYLCLFTSFELVRLTEVSILFRDNKANSSFISTHDLNALSGDFLGYNMTQITGVTIISNTLYIARSASDASLPSEVRASLCFSSPPPRSAPFR